MVLPTGVVTFVFTDIEGSTALLNRLGEGYGDVLFAHDRLLRDVWAEHDGVQFSTEGDSFCVAFTSASAAVAACGAAQESLAANDWPHGEPVRVRMGVHSGEPRVHGSGYWGPDVHYAARVASAARGGQVLVSAATAGLVGAGFTLASLGRHRLRDFPEPLELFALGAGPHPAPRTLDPLRSNLPSAPNELIGRDEVVGELVACLAGEGGLVTLTGAGGLGKTRVALAVAEQLVDRLADGAFLVELAEVSSHESVVGAIADVVGAGRGVDALSAALASREMLLVLDNFEHVIDAAPVLAGLVSDAPKVRVLITSRTPLRVACERVWALEPLAVPQADTPVALQAAPAALLLAARAQRSAPGFRVDERNAGAVAALCRELDGSPLAIELAAARLALLGPAELLDRLRESPDALGKGSRDLPERQRGLRAAMTWTFGLLDRDGAALFRRLGHFAADTTLERIEQVCGEEGMDVLESLALLVDLSLVRRTRAGRFELPSALRAFARELLDGSGEGNMLFRRHAQVVADELLSIRLDRPLESSPLVRHAVGEEYADILALLEWAARGDLEQFGRLMAAAHEPLVEHGDLDDRWREPIERILASDLLTGRIRHLVATADRVLRQRRGEELETWLEFSLNGDTGEDPVHWGWRHGVAVAVDISEGLMAESPLWPTVVTVAADLAASPVAGLRNLASDLEGFLFLAQERWDEAAAAFEATVAGGGTTWVAEAALFVLGDCQLLAGRPHAALSGYTRGLKRAAALAQRGNMGFQADGIAAALADLGRYEDALEALGASDVLAPEGYRPRDRHPHWPRILTPRIEAARGALGPKRAEAAYTRGATISTDQVGARVLALAGTAADASAGAA